MNWGQLLNGFSSKLGVVRIRSAMNPFVAIILIVAGVFVIALKLAPVWCLVAVLALFSIVVIAALFVAIRFSIVDPSRLQTEDHRYKMAALMQQNGSVIRIDGPFAENPALVQATEKAIEASRSSQQEEHR